MDNVDEHIKELELRLHQFLDMDNVDEHIKELVKAKFLEDGYYYKPELDGSSDDISVLKTDMGWGCGCYSDWTRDDNFIVRAEMKTLTRTVEFPYNTWWNMPDFLQELSEYIENEQCPYWED